MIELKQGFYKKKEDYSLKEVKQNHGGGSIDREISLKGTNQSWKKKSVKRKTIYIYIYIGKEDEKKGIENV